MVTPYMSLLLPTVSVTLGPTYATENNTAFTTIDSHDHTSGKGVQVPSAGIGINSELSFAGFDATDLRSTRYSAQGSPLALVTDVGCLYVAGVDLYYNDGNGNQIQLTAGGALNAASIGGIGGDYSTSTASVFYTNSSKTFGFWQDTNKSALIDVGTILLRRVDNTSSAAITIAPSTSLASGYSIILPIALPASASFLSIDNTGAVAFTNSLASLTLSGALTLSALTASRAMVTDGSKVVTSSAATATEVGYLSGVTSAIQTQINSKITSPAVNADISASAAIAYSKLAALTASRALVSDGSGVVSVATTTATEIGYVNGVTSAIQTQLNNKLTTTSVTTFSPTVTLAGAGMVPVYSTNAGRYMQVGSLVYVDVYLDGDDGAEGSGSTQLRVALPVTASASNNTGIFPAGSSINGGTPVMVGGQIVGSGTYVSLYLGDTSSEYVAMEGQDQNSTTRSIRLKFWYEA